MAEAMNSPKVTVLLPVYNAATFLSATLNSILAQSFTDFELLAIDDASSDDSRAILRAVNDPRIRLVEHAVNQGLIATLNEGIELARGEFIARMDNDDVMHPDRLAVQVEAMEKDKGLTVLASWVRTINADGTVVGEWDIDRSTPDEASIHAMLPRTNCIAHPSVMLRKSALGDMRYDPRQPGTEDWDLWLRLRARGHRISKIPRVLLDYRIHPGSIMGGQKQTVSYERRLLTTRHRYLMGELGRTTLNRSHLPVLKAQLRTLARHLSRNVLPTLARNLHRRLTYSPLGILREQSALRNAERTWKGRTAIFIPYLHTGGAEQVHADIVSAVADTDPLVVVSGFSTDRRFAKLLEGNATLLELPRSLNHPDWQRRTVHRLAALINAQAAPTVLGALSTSFFDLLPQLRMDVPAYHLQHAFLHQPEGNVQHRQWLKHFARVSGYIFISSRARDEFARFLHANHIPRSATDKLHLIGNAVHRFGTVRSHERTGLIWIGRDSKEKRLTLFLQLADALERLLPGAFRFSTAGPVQVEGHPHVCSLGHVQDPDRIATILAEHDLLVLTSDREGFPLVIMEGMAQGLAVVSTPVGDVPVRLTSDEAMITSSVEAAPVLEEMTTAILALDADRERLQRMKAAALEKARKEFDPERFTASYRALLIRP
jgi:glycosyltransferase involved in cell wall biosynthesis